MDNPPTPRSDLAATWSGMANDDGPAPLSPTSSKASRYFARIKSGQSGLPPPQTQDVNQMGKTGPAATWSGAAFEEEVQSPVSETSSKALSYFTRIKATSQQAVVAPPSHVQEINQVSIDKRVRLAEDKLVRYLTNEDRKLQLISEAAKKSLDEIYTLKDEREIVHAQERELIGSVSSVLHSRVSDMARERVNGESDREERIVDDLKQLSDEVAQLRKAREETQTRFARKIGEEISRISGELDKQRDLRTMHGEKIANTLYEQLQGVQSDLMDTRDKRMESENELIKMIEEMCLNIRTEIDNERILREHGEEQLLQLLEETCARVEANFAVVSTGRINVRG